MAHSPCLLHPPRVRPLPPAVLLTFRLKPEPACFPLPVGRSVTWAHGLKLRLAIGPSCPLPPTCCRLSDGAWSYFYPLHLHDDKITMNWPIWPANPTMPLREDWWSSVIFAGRNQLKTWVCFDFGFWAFFFFFFLSDCVPSAYSQLNWGLSFFVH